MFFQVIASRCEIGSIMVTSNLPFGRWGETFSDDLIAAAMIDRLVHHAEVLTLTGDSYRTRARRELLSRDRAESTRQPRAGPGRIRADGNKERHTPPAVGWCENRCIPSSRPSKCQPVEAKNSRAGRLSGSTNAIHCCVGGCPSQVSTEAKTWRPRPERRLGGQTARSVIACATPAGSQAHPARPTAAPSAVVITN